MLEATLLWFGPIEFHYCWPSLCFAAEPNSTHIPITHYAVRQLIKIASTHHIEMPMAVMIALTKHGLMVCAAAKTKSQVNTGIVLHRRPGQL